MHLNHTERQAQIACAMAVRLAARFSMVEPLRQLALDRAQSIEGLREHCQWIDSVADCEQSADERFDGAQKAILCSIHLAHALENAGLGLDREQLIALSNPLQEIISPDASLTDFGLEVFENYDEAFHEHMLGEDDELSPSVFFKKIAALTEASKIAEAAAQSSATRPRKRM